jgi:hypothetical protein
MTGSLDIEQLVSLVGAQWCSGCHVWGIVRGAAVGLYCWELLLHLDAAVMVHWTEA